MTDAYGYPQIHAAAAAIRERLGLPADKDVAPVGVVLGSGLGHVGDALIDGGGKSLHFAEIPHFPTSGVVGHKGRLVFAEHEGTPVLVLQGRVHAYEGWPAAAVVFPVRVLMALGATRLVLTNAAGGLQEGMTPGDLMLIDDHLNMTGSNPLLGENDDRLGPRFPDMSDTYTGALREIAMATASEQGLTLKRGYYAGLLGPSYETPAEIQMLRVLGASAVGMSTVYEAIAASHGQCQVLGISCITNLAAGISPTKLSHDEVKETAGRVEQAFAKLVLTLIGRIAG